MSLNFEIIAEQRDDQGKGASRRLRRAGKVPAILYGGDKPPAALTLDHNSLWLNLQHEVFYSHILTIKLDGKTEKAILRDLQRHPYKQQILHADLLRVTEDKAVRVHIPLHFVHEATAPGIKTGGGIVNHLMVEVEIECLPKHLPEYIEVELGQMELDQSLHLSDLKLPEGVSIVALSHGADHDHAVVSIHRPRGSAAAEEGTGEETPAA